MIRHSLNLEHFFLYFFHFFAPFASLTLFAAIIHPLLFPVVFVWYVLRHVRPGLLLSAHPFRHAR